jgi:hypothetical protein
MPYLFTEAFESVLLDAIFLTSSDSIPRWSSGRVLLALLFASPSSIGRFDAAVGALLPLS